MFPDFVKWGKGRLFRILTITLLLIGLAVGAWIVARMALLHATVVVFPLLAPKVRARLHKIELFLASYMFDHSKSGGNTGSIMHSGVAGDDQQHFPSEAPHEAQWSKGRYLPL